MSQTKVGAQKALKKIYDTYGEDYFVKMGSLGGRASTTGGTYGRPEWAAHIGSIGGKKSRRGPSLKTLGKTPHKVVDLSHGRTLETSNHSPRLFSFTKWRSIFRYKSRPKKGV